VRGERAGIALDGAVRRGGRGDGDQARRRAQGSTTSVPFIPLAA
jgi:hypothetical protein